MINSEAKLHLVAAGINVDSAMARFLNNAALMEKFLRRFPNDSNYSLLCQAMAQGDADAAFTAAHTLKGVAGNLSLDRLFAATSAVVESLRGKDLAMAEQQMPPLHQAYREVIEALAAWQ